MTSAANAHLKILDLELEPSETEGQFSVRDGETRAQAYNRRLRERMEARDSARAKKAE